MEKTEEAESRVAFDEGGDNGLALSGKYLPEELIAKILFNVDCDTLLNCQLVCARWKTLIDTYVWRKKAESIFGRSLHLLNDVDWSVYYTICKKRAFERNLIKNCSGQKGIRKHWEIVTDGWNKEAPPAGIPCLPLGVWPYKGKECCFATSLSETSKQQSIDLGQNGFPAHVLDTFQPSIAISEWYGCRFDCGGLYDLWVQLLDASGNVLDEFRFRLAIGEEAQNKWHYISHVFENYGPGLRKIVFRHAGLDSKCWAGQYRVKMTCATVRVKILKEPEPTPDTSCPTAEQPEILLVPENIDDQPLDHVRNIWRFNSNDEPLCR